MGARRSRGGPHLEKEKEKEDALYLNKELCELRRTP